MFGVDDPIGRRDLFRAVGRASVASVLGLPLLSLVGCGGGGGGGHKPAPGGDPGGGTTGTPVSVENRTKALSDALAEFDRLRDGRASCDATAMAAFLKGQPWFDRVAVMPDGCVWARFTDGQHYVIGNNVPEPGPSSVRTMRAPRPSLMDGFPQSGVPESNVARVWTTISSYVYIDESEGQVSPPFGLLKRMGWDVGDERTGVDLDDLRTLPELGFLAWFTHGGMLNQDGSIAHALMTGTSVDPAGIVANLTDLNLGTVIYYGGPTGHSRGKWLSDNYFAITPAFIRAYGWRLSKDSIVLIHACASDDPGFKAAFQAAGAGLYGGWDKPVFLFKAGDALTATMDGLFALNGEAPTPDPRRRAFSYESVKKATDDLELTKYHDPLENETVEFVYTELNGKPGAAMPTMERMIVQEHLGQLILRGSFGSKRGKVVMGSTLETDPSGATNYIPYWPGGTVRELAVKSWKPEEIVVDLPEDAAGYVAVKVGDRIGNARAVTEWKGLVKVRGDAPGELALRMDVHFRIRADAGLWRDEYPGDPKDALCPFIGAEGADATYFEYQAGGSHTATVPGPATAITRWNATGTVELKMEGQPGDAEFMRLTGWFDRTRGEMRALFTGGKIQGLTGSATISHAGGTFTNPIAVNLGMPRALIGASGAASGMRFEIDENLKIAAGSLEATEPCPTAVGGEEAPTIVYTISWDEIEPRFAPNGKGGE